MESSAEKKDTYVSHSDYLHRRAQEHLSANIAQQLSLNPPDQARDIPTQPADTIDLTQDDTDEDETTQTIINTKPQTITSIKPKIKLLTRPTTTYQSQGHAPARGGFQALPIDNKLQAQKQRSYSQAPRPVNQNIFSMINAAAAQAEPSLMPILTPTIRPTTTLATAVPQFSDATPPPAADTSKPKSSYSQMKEKLLAQIEEQSEEIAGLKENIEQQDSIIEENNIEYANIARENGSLRQQIVSLNRQLQTPASHLASSMAARVRAEKDAELVELRASLAQANEGLRQAKEANDWLVKQNAVGVLRLEREKFEAEARANTLAEASGFSFSDAQRIVQAKEELLGRVPEAERGDRVLVVEERRMAGAWGEFVVKLE